MGTGGGSLAPLPPLINPSPAEQDVGVWGGYVVWGACPPPLPPFSQEEPDCDVTHTELEPLPLPKPGPCFLFFFFGAIFIFIFYFKFFHFFQSHSSFVFSRFNGFAPQSETWASLASL